MKSREQKREQLLESLKDFGDFEITPVKPTLCAPYGEDLSSYGFEKVEWAPMIWQGAEPLPNEDPLFVDNKVFAIGLASVLACLQLDVKPGSRVLDMCAAPGIKSLYLQLLHDKKLDLYVNDVSQARLKRLRALFNSFQVSLPTFSNQPGQSLLNRYEEGYFDAIIIDAPCSGEGNILKGDEKALETWSLAKVKRLASLQRKLLKTADRLRNRNGELVYSTCTLNLHENETAVRKAGFVLESSENYEIQDLRVKTNTSVRLLPSESSIGFFIAKL